MSNSKEETVKGIVIEALPNTMFRVDVNGTTITAYLAGKMRFNRIKVMVGDSVEMLLDPYGGKARVVKRL